jgi:Flp pilus assembly protein CpaB
VKNIIPLVIAVILGLAAVFAVSRTISKQMEHSEQMVEIVSASRVLEANETLIEGFIVPRLVPASALPKQHIKWENKAMVIGQKLLHTVAKGDYLLLTDIGMTRSMGNVIGDGEWGLPVTFADSALVKVLQPGDEIAIIGSFKVQETIKQGKDIDDAPETIIRTVTTVIYPRVRILDITGSGVFLSLPPQQAIALTAIQRNAELYPLLRKTNDTKALNRKDGGIFMDEALHDLVDGLTPITIPNVPAEINE